jgi:uncharacterized protein YqeY
MSLQKQIMEELKTAMKSKDAVALQALRAVKSAFLLAKTETGAGDDLTEDQEMKIIQKQVKQRKDSAAIFIRSRQAKILQIQNWQKLQFLRSFCLKLYLKRL